MMRNIGAGALGQIEIDVGAKRFSKVGGQSAGVSLAELDPAGRCFGRRGDRRGRCCRRRCNWCHWCHRYHRHCHRRRRRHCHRCRRCRRRRYCRCRQCNRRSCRRCCRRRCHYCRIYCRRYSGTRRARSVNTHYRRLAREGGGRSPPPCATATTTAVVVTTRRPPLSSAVPAKGCRRRHYGILSRSQTSRLLLLRYDTSSGV